MSHPVARLEAWRSLADAARQDAARELAGALGGLEALPELAGAERLPVLRERESGLRLVAVPGGELELGFTAAHRDELLRHFRSFDNWLQRSRPTRRVRVPSLLVGQAPLLVPEVERARPGAGRPWPLADRVLLDDDDAPAGAPPAELPSEAVPAVLAALRGRLPSEAEWEYAASGAGAQAWLFGPGGYRFAAAARAAEALLRAPRFDPALPVEHPFGLWGLLSAEWVADAWRPSYQGAPADASPGDPPAAPENHRGGPAATYPWQDQAEVLACHTASRAPAPYRGSLPARLVRDLPEAFGGRAIVGA